MADGCVPLGKSHAPIAGRGISPGSAPPSPRGAIELTADVLFARYSGEQGWSSMARRVASYCSASSSSAVRRAKSSRPLAAMAPCSTPLPLPKRMPGLGSASKSHSGTSVVGQVAPSRPLEILRTLNTQADLFNDWVAAAFRKGERSYGHSREFPYSGCWRTTLLAESTLFVQTKISSPAAAQLAAPILGKLPSCSLPGSTSP